MSSIALPAPGIWVPPKITAPKFRRKYWWKTRTAQDALVAAISIISSNSQAATALTTFPTHASGDWLGLFAYRDGIATAPSVPSAGGTVPTWTTVDSGGANSNASIFCWCKATASNHTSGTWTNATGIGVIVLRGQDATSPVSAAHATGGSAANGSNIPVVDMAGSPVVDGSSFFISAGGYRTVTAWGTPPSGYTIQTSVATELFIATKDVTTSHATWNEPTTQSGNGGYRTHQLEVIAAAGGGGGSPASNTTSFFF